MRKRILTDLIGAAIFAGIFASFLFFGMRAKAAEPDRSELAAIPRYEMADMRSAEDWQPISAEELDLLAALVMAEAGNQDYTGKCLVVDVVLNRVASAAWPNSITDVIYQSGQFAPVTDGGLARGYATVTQDCYDAVLQELTSQIDYGVIYFSAGYCANGVFAYQHGAHYFGY